jgi:hypothetical protein
LAINGRSLSEGLRTTGSAETWLFSAGALPIESFEVSRWRSAQRALLYGYSIAAVVSIVGV